MMDEDDNTDSSQSVNDDRKHSRIGERLSFSPITHPPSQDKNGDAEAQPADKKMATMRTMEMRQITRIRRLLVSRNTFPCYHGHCSLHRRRRIQLRSTIVSVQVKEFGQTTQKQMRVMGDRALSVQIPC